MPRLALLPIGAFAIWAYVCQQWYVCSIKQRCGEDVPAIVTNDTTAAPATNTYAIGFKWNSAEPEAGSGYDNLLKSAVAGVGENQLFEIVGKYYADETPPEGYANMGLARADMVKKLFDGKIAEDRIVATSSQLGSKSPESLKMGYIDGVFFNYKEIPKGDEVEIIEVENQISILFPYASSTREADPRVDQYLEKLAARLKLTTETVSITGHTDAAGNDDFNYQLGLNRAKHIRDILLSKGIAKDRISIDSKGKKVPVASNDTEEGRRQNRRVELLLNKKE